MIALLRSLVVYCMLLALPYQGYAAAAMMACLPGGAAAVTNAAAAAAAAAPAAAHLAMPAGPHDHAAMMAAIEHQQSVSAQSDSASSHADHTHGGVKCGGAACCIASAPVLAHLLSVPALAAVSSAVVLYADYLPAVDLAHPERPPQA